MAKMTRKEWFKELEELEEGSSWRWDLNTVRDNYVEVTKKDGKFRACTVIRGSKYHDIVDMAEDLINNIEYHFHLRGYKILTAFEYLEEWAKPSILDFSSIDDYKMSVDTIQDYLDSLVYLNDDDLIVEKKYDNGFYSIGDFIM